MRFNMKCISLLFGFFFSSLLMAQIDSNSKFYIDSVLIYKDYKKMNTFYYAPNKLELVYDSNSKPDFQFLKMRYVGTQCYGDNQSAHETNLVQLQVKMNAISSEQLTHLKNKLKTYYTNPILLPFPISHIESTLMVASETVQNQKITIASNESEEVSPKNLTQNKSYWTNRFFTFRMQNEQAILFENMLKSSDMSMSFSYAFYADTTNPIQEMSFSGTPELVKEIEKNRDSIPHECVNRLIFSDAFAIPINTVQFPDLIKNLDINESFPPTHATVTVKNYDFTENLRPELYLKKIEVSAISVDHEKEVIVETKFSKSTPEINSHSIYFPYAVYVNHPMKYRITEITNEGVKKTFPWIEFSNCNQILDITSTSQERKIEAWQFEVECDSSWFEFENAKMVLLISYQLNNQKMTKYVDVVSNDLFKMALYHDMDSQIHYEIVYSSNQQSDFHSEKYELKDAYLYIPKLF